MPDSESMTEAWTYIARTTVPSKRFPKVGTAVAVTVDSPDRVSGNAKLVARWMSQGLIIERVPVEWAREHLLTNTPYVSAT